MRPPRPPFFGLEKPRTGILFPAMWTESRVSLAFITLQVVRTRACPGDDEPRGCFQKATTGDNMEDIKHFVRAFGYSLAGFSSAFRHEMAFRQEVVVAAILLPFAIWLDHTSLERVLLIGSLLFVLVVELLNSAVEASVDRVGREHHPLAGRAKDFGSAAVFLTIANAIMVWVFITILPRIG